MNEPKLAWMLEHLCPPILMPIIALILLMGYKPQGRPNPQTTGWK